MGRKGTMILCIMLCFLMTGCGSALPEMTQEQEARIVDYAVQLALDYDGNYESRLVDLDLYQDIETGDTGEENKEEEPSGGMDPTTEIPTTDNSQEQEEHAESIEQFYHMEGIEIQYEGFQVCASYPQYEGGDLGFALDAVEGKKLLVMSFAVKNITAEEIALDFLSVSPRFRVSVNGDKSVSILFALVEDNLTTYVGNIPAGETVELVMIAEITEEKSTDIQTLELIMRNDSESNKKILQ